MPTVASRRRKVILTLPDVTVALVTDAGVFSADAVDPGTKLLLLDGPSPPTGAHHLLDLGCGYGPIAITLSLRAPDATVWAVEVNQRARALCAENAAVAGVQDRVRVVAPDEVPDDVLFEALWSNPPVRVGKPVLHELLRTWLGRLGPHGTAHLVVHKHLGADSLARWLAGQGWTVERAGSRMGYRRLELDRSDVRPAEDP